MKSFILTLLDSAFSAFICFVLSFLIINFYVKRPFSIIFSVCIAIPVFIIALERIKKSNQLKGANNKHRIALENMVYSLCLLERAKLLELFERAINSLDVKTIKKKHGIFIESKNCAVFPIFNFDGITKTDVVKVFNSITKPQKAYIVGEKLSAEVKSFMDRFNQNIEFIDAEKTYQFLEKTNCLPPERLSLTRGEGKKMAFFKRIITRKHSSKFLAFGFLFILSSWFVPIKMYYVVYGCIFLMLSLICRLYGQEPNKE